MWTPNRRLALWPSDKSILAAGTFVGESRAIPRNVNALHVQGALTYSSGGTTCKVYVQTSLDGGTTWIDVACLAFATATATKVSAVRTSIALAAATVPTDGTLADDTIVDGLYGDRVRVKVIVVGTYVASTLAVDCVPH